MEEVEDYSWLEDLINSLPELQKKRRNFFDISGFPNWENVNSNLLGFYFDEFGDHGFKRLFFESLLDCIQQEFEVGDDFDRTHFESTFKIHREYTTNQGGRIDLLLVSDEEQYESEVMDEQADIKNELQWAIIIENKIHHQLVNNLNDYWDSIKARNKIGIVLSPYINSEADLKITEGLNFISITHHELVEKIVTNLSNYFYDADDRHLLFLKEYIGNINTLYKSPMEEETLLKQLNQFHQHNEAVVALLSVNEKLLSFINDEVTKAMKGIDFESVSSNSARAKHFYPIKNEGSDFREQQAFRFWVDLNRLRFKKDFHCIFELYDFRNTGQGSKLRTELEGKISYNGNLKKSQANISKHQCHLFYIEFDMNGFQETGLSKKIEAELKRILLWKQDENRSKVLQTILENWEKIKH